MIQNSTEKGLTLSSSKGFTLLELLLCFALIALLLGVSTPIYFSLFSRNDLAVATNEVAQSLGRASFLSAASQGDCAWGVKVIDGSIVIFKGAVVNNVCDAAPTYSTRDADYDEIYSIASSVSVNQSGITEVVFYKMTGLPVPQDIGTITLTSTNGESKTITINAKGTITY